MSRTLSVKAYLALTLGLLFVILSVVVIVLVNSTMKRLALTDAEHSARMLLDHNLAIHTYFSQDLKPKLFERFGPTTSKDYFEPVWMSSTYAIRKMDGYFHHFNKSPYYYKECAINARSPENEADNYEKAFLVELQNSPQLTTKTAIRDLDGKPYFTLLRRGESMEESCLHCHSSPEKAPGDLVQRYGPERSFHRKVQDVVQAISIRIPLSEAFSSATIFSLYLSGLLLAALGGGFFFVWVGNKRLVISPLAEIQEKAVRIASEHEHLGETIPPPKVRELRDLVISFNQMSVELRKTYDGLEQRVLERTKALSDANQQLKKEITDRKRSEKALSENEARYRSLFENMRNAVAVYKAEQDGEDFILVDFNAAGERIDNTDRGRVIGQRLLKVFPGVKEFGLFDVFQRVWRTGEPESHPVALYSDERIEGWRANFVYKLPTGEIVAVYSDETDRKRADEELQKQVSLMESLLEAIPAPVFFKDTNHIYLGCNQAFAEFIGRPKENIIGKSVLEVAPKELAEVYRAQDEALFKNPIPQIYESSVKSSDGTTHDVIFHKATFADSSGAVAGLIGVILDITDRKRAEELALQAVRLRSVADLSSGVAHHFNNLLQIVMASTSLSLADLESGDLSEVKTNLEKMLDAASLGAETVRRLQTFANVRADIAEAEAAVFDIATTAKNAAEFSKPLWKAEPAKKGIKVDLQLEVQDGCLVKGQENEMFEVLVDLIRNAAEAMPDGGNIEAKVCKEADAVVIEVRDTGIGIAEEDLPRVFQPFWSSKGVSIGKGMGLAVSHGLVKRHGGTISVQSKVGAGTTFTIRLPLTQESVRKPEQPAMSTAEDHLTILVIDDDLNIATLLERICAKAGHTVFKALSGKEGLAIFNKEPVDLVFCDLGMPGMSGWDVGKAIRSICWDRGITKPPFILLTGWGGQELEREKIAESGTDAVVAKPIDSPALLATVQEIAQRFNIRSRVT